ncbi:MAG TPA: ATPase domain-containing protein [Thermoplasmata archaeon]|nr:ATPase domain-containing protein [Thermoplasmata archaeon]
MSPTETAPAAVGNRVATGSPELDTMLSGGLLPGRPYLIVGPSGTGKTKLALRFLCEGVRRGESVLMITLEEPPNEMKINHRGMSPEIDQVYVFDAIPDVMRYERAPFKDIAAVRSSSRFSDTSPRIRQSPELASVEVTFTALEQTLKMEIARRSYKRLVIDSLTALQYFCMKGFDEVVGAQSFIRFLSDLRITTLLTVEAPLEDVESPERQLARGEIRLFRWDLDGRTVRAIGVEKIRGSPHDVRLHPYRITPDGIEIQLRETISRDTRQIVEGLAVAPELTRVPAPPPEVPPATVPALDLGAFEQEVAALTAAGADLAPVRTALAAAVSARARSRPDAAARQVERAAAISHALLAQLRGARPPPARREAGGASEGAHPAAGEGPEHSLQNFSPAALEASWPRVERLLASTSPGALPPTPALPSGAVAPPPPPVRVAPIPSPSVARPAPPTAPSPLPSPPEPAPRSGRPIARAASRIAGAFTRGSPPSRGLAGAPTPAPRPEHATPRTLAPSVARPPTPVEPVGEIPTTESEPPESAPLPPASVARPPAVGPSTPSAADFERPPLPTPVLLPAPPAPVAALPALGPPRPTLAEAPVASTSADIAPPRKARAAAPRKRSAKRAAPSPAIVEPSVQPAPSSTAGTTTPLAEPGGPAEVVPRVNRRKPRKKKAPSVEGAVPAPRPSAAAPEAQSSPAIAAEPASTAVPSAPPASVDGGAPPSG